MRFAVLVDIGSEWPEVVFVGDADAAHAIADDVPADIGVSVQAVVLFEEIVPDAESVKY